MNGPLQAAIVDLDGTMVDTLGDFAVALNRMLDELSLPPSNRGDRAMVGKGSEHLIRSVLAHVGAARLRCTTRAWQLLPAALPGHQRPACDGVSRA